MGIVCDLNLNYQSAIQNVFFTHRKIAPLMVFAKINSDS